MHALGTSAYAPDLLDGDAAGQQYEDGPAGARCRDRARRRGSGADRARRAAPDLAGHRRRAQCCVVETGPGIGSADPLGLLGGYRGAGR